MRDLLFSVPWYLPILTGIIGLALLVNGNRRQNPGMRNSGAGVIAAALGWALMSYLVETPKENCEKLTRQFVQSVVDRNWPTFDGLLEPGVNFKYVGSSWQITGQPTLSKAVKADVEAIGLKTATTTDVKASDKNDLITVEMKVWSNQEKTMGTPIDSEWELDWKESNGNWKLHEIRATRVANLQPDQVRGSVPMR